MDDTHKMLQAIIHGQNTLKQELLHEIRKVDKRVEKLDERVDGLDKKIDKVERKLTKRIDNLGKQLAYLDEDAPTREEHAELVGRVEKLEQKIAPTL